jgi:hypothetical protein
VCLISIIRLVIVSRLDFSDVPWQFSVVAYWSAVEVNLAIICACLTTLKPLVARFFPKLLGSTADPTHGPTTGTHQARGTIVGGAATAQRHTAPDGRSFVHLDDESLKSDEDDQYELSSAPGKQGYVMTPTKSYATASAGHR